MTTAQAVDLFAVIQDKYGSPDFNAEETYDLLNMATFEWLNRQFPNSEGGLTNVEQDQNALHLIRPLIHSFTVNGSVVASGAITNAVLEAAMAAAVGGSETIFRFLEVNYTQDNKTHPVKWLRHNNMASAEVNVFKRPRVPDKVRYQLLSTNIRLKPATGYSTGVFSFTVIKSPKLLSGSQNPELTDEGMYNVISIALKLAGVATRDDELLGAVRASAVQISQ